MEQILERIVIIIILIYSICYNLTLGYLVCFIIIIIYLHQQQFDFNYEEGFDNIKDDCDVVKIPNVQIITTTNYTAIIIEPRKHKALPFVLKNFTENLSSNWNFIIYHGYENENMIHNIVFSFPEEVKSRITLVNLNVKNIRIDQYSTMFFCPTFYHNIPTETFLIFQTDSIILKENKDKINDFLKYDYVGAPWPKSMGVLGKMVVGNGGLSLRKKSKMMELLKYKKKAIFPNKYGKYIAEDQFFCGYYVKEVELFKPTFIKAMDFSVEAVYSEAPFGIHKLWSGLNNRQINILITKYPDIKTLIELNK